MKKRCKVASCQKKFDVYRELDPGEEPTPDLVFCPDCAAAFKEEMKAWDRKVESFESIDLCRSERIARFGFDWMHNWSCYPNTQGTGVETPGIRKGRAIRG